MAVSLCVCVCVHRKKEKKKRKQRAENGGTNAFANTLDVASSFTTTNQQTNTNQCKPIQNKAATSRRRALVCALVHAGRLREVVVCLAQLAQALLLLQQLVLELLHAHL